MTTKQNIKAIIYDKKGRVLSIGENSYNKTHTTQAYHANKVGLPHKVFLHAEVHAITRLTELKKAHRIHIIRTLKDGSHGNAKPCPVCESAIKAAGIKYVTYTE